MRADMHENGKISPGIGRLRAVVLAVPAFALALSWSMAAQSAEHEIHLSGFPEVTISPDPLLGMTGGDTVTWIIDTESAHACDGERDITSLTIRFEVYANPTIGPEEYTVLIPPPGGEDATIEVTLANPLYYRVYPYQILTNGAHFCDNNPRISIGAYHVLCPAGDGDGADPMAINRSPDLNMDGKIDLVDLGYFAQYYFGVPEECANFNADLHINLSDLAIMAYHYHHEGVYFVQCDTRDQW